MRSSASSTASPPTAIASTREATRGPTDGERRMDETVRKKLQSAGTKLQTNGQKSPIATPYTHHATFAVNATGYGMGSVVRLPRRRSATICGTGLAPRQKARREPIAGIRVFIMSAISTRCFRSAHVVRVGESASVAARIQHSLGCVAYSKQ
eukprot:6740750-Prymnesium_polylepis.1